MRDLLAEHVPLALIVDLVTPEATSAEILESEGLPDDAWWEKDATTSDRRPARDGRHGRPISIGRSGGRPASVLNRAPLAQLAEQLTLNQRVRGSSP